MYNTTTGAVNWPPTAPVFLDICCRSTAVAARGPPLRERDALAQSYQASGPGSWLRPWRLRAVPDPAGRRSDVVAAGGCVKAMATGRLQHDLQRIQGPPARRAPPLTFGPATGLPGRGSLGQRDQAPTCTRLPPDPWRSAGGDLDPTLASDRPLRTQPRTSYQAIRDDDTARLSQVDGQHDRGGRAICRRPSPSRRPPPAWPPQRRGTSCFRRPRHPWHPPRPRGK